jgi:hypothetical protein
MEFLVTNFQSPFAGEQPPIEDKGPPEGVSLDSFAGPVHVEWDTEAALTPLGQLPFFIDFLKAAGLFDAFVADCPLRYTSPNAPKKRDVLGTTMLSMLSGQALPLFDEALKIASEHKLESELHISATLNLVRRRIGHHGVD